MGLVILEPVQVLVPFPAHLAAEGLLLLHAHCAGVGDRRFGIDDGEGPIRVLVKLLVCMTVLEVRSAWSHRRIGVILTYRLVVFESVLVLVRFFASYHGTSEWLDLFTRHHSGRAVTDTDHHLLFADSLGELAVRTILPTSKSKLCILVRGIETTVWTEQSFGWLVNTQI